MEIILAIVVATAVIFFGALISIGNEQQRRAIDSLREQTTFWAVQDIKIKRERFAHEIKITDPVGWFNNIASNLCGFDLKLKFIEPISYPQGLIFISEADNTKVIFSTFSKKDSIALKDHKKSRLHTLSDQHPLHLGKSFELNVLNCGILFDLELPMAWLGVSNQTIGTTDRVWMYVIK